MNKTDVEHVLKAVHGQEGWAVGYGLKPDQTYWCFLRHEPTGYQAEIEYSEGYTVGEWHE